MIKKNLFLFLSLLFISCSDEGDIVCDTIDFIAQEKVPGMYSFNFFENKKIQLKSFDGMYQIYGVVEEGNKLVFEYYFDADEKIEIADDEYAETIRFEIQPELKSFSYCSSELSKIKLVFTKYCFCDFTSTNLKERAPQGTISGNKISDTEWEIKMNVTFYGNEQKSFIEVFTLKK